MLSEAEQDYLKTIYKIQNKTASNGVVQTNHVADEMDVKAASVTKMVKNLHRKKLLHYQPYRGMHLTEVGEKVALEIIRHHRLIELFLNKALDMPWDEVHDEAERLEHSLSQSVASRLDAILGHPTVDPHGQPIPNAKGIYKKHRSCPLTDLEHGSESIILEINDQNAELLRTVAQLGLHPQQNVTVLSRDDEGSLTVMIGTQEQVIARNVAEHIFVQMV